LACPACPGATSSANIAMSILFISPGNTASALHARSARRLAGGSGPGSNGVLGAFHHSITPVLQQWRMEKVVHLIQKRNLWPCII